MLIVVTPDVGRWRRANVRRFTADIVTPSCVSRSAANNSCQAPRTNSAKVDISFFYKKINSLMLNE